MALSLQATTDSTVVKAIQSPLPLSTLQRMPSRSEVPEVWHFTRIASLQVMSPFSACTESYAECRIWKELKQ